jgi:exopolysaccharide biosynthesis protein
VGDAVYQQRLCRGETLLTVQGDKVVSQKQANKAGTTVPIPNDGYLLVVRANQDALAALPVGTSLTIESLTQPDNFDRFAQVVGAGPLLVQNGRTVLNAQSEKFSNSFIEERAPRSVIATTQQGTMLLLTIHQRLGGSGPSLAEAAQLAQQLGVVNALNLDGGSSTTLYLGGQLLNRASSTAASVNNGIGVFIEPTP